MVLFIWDKCRKGTIPEFLLWLIYPNQDKYAFHKMLIPTTERVI